MLRDICSELNAIRDRIEAVAEALAVADNQTVRIVPTWELIQELHKADSIIKSVRLQVEGVDHNNN